MKEKRGFFKIDGSGFLVRCDALEGERTLRSRTGGRCVSTVTDSRAAESCKSELGRWRTRANLSLMCDRSSMASVTTAQDSGV
jgi:hypothetical protein